MHGLALGWCLRGSYYVPFSSSTGLELILILRPTGRTGTTWRSLADRARTNLAARPYLICGRASEVHCKPLRLAGKVIVDGSTWPAPAYLWLGYMPERARSFVLIRLDYVARSRTRLGARAFPRESRLLSFALQPTFSCTVLCMRSDARIPRLRR